MSILPPRTIFNKRDMIALTKMLIPMIFVIFVGWHFHTFIINAIMGNLAINAGILVTASYGVVIIVIRLISAQSDRRALDRFSEEALEGTNMNELLSQDWIKSLTLRQYLKPIAQTEGTLASQLDQNAIESELHALEGEYESKMELPQFLVGFMIAMGLLGTFIGLLETLTGISGMLDGMSGSTESITDQFANLVVELRKPLSGMGMAFSASMFGLVSSLMLSFMMIMLRRYINGVTSKARGVMHDLTTRVSAPFQMQGMGQSFGQQADTGSGTMSADLQALFMRSETRMAHLSDSMGALVEKLNFIFAFSEDSSKKGKEVEAGEGGGLFGPHLLAAVRGLGEIETAQKGSMETMADSLTELDQKMGVMLTGSGDQKEHYRAMLSLNKDSAAKMEEISSAMRAISDGAITLAPMIDKKLGPVATSVRESATTQHQIATKLGEMYNVDMDTMRHMMEVKEIFVKLAPTLELVGTLVDNTNQQNLLLEASLDETRNAQKHLISTLQRELQNFTQTLGKAMGISVPSGDQE